MVPSETSNNAKYTVISVMIIADVFVLSIQSTMEDVDPPEQNFKLVIDWRLFLVALADAHFDYFLSKSSIDDIVQARTGD